MYRSILLFHNSTYQQSGQKYKLLLKRHLYIYVNFHIPHSGSVVLKIYGKTHIFSNLIPTNKIQGEYKAYYSLPISVVSVFTSPLLLWLVAMSDQAIIMLVEIITTNRTPLSNPSVFSESGMAKYSKMEINPLGEINV